MARDLTPARAGHRRRRPDLADGTLQRLVLVTTGAAAVALVAGFLFPIAFQRPGTPLMQLLGAVGAVLLLTPFAYVIAKRTGASAVPNRWLVAHVLASLAGLVLVVLHSGGKLLSPPSAMLYALAGLVASGGYARVRAARDMASTLGRKDAAFAAPSEDLRARLRAVIARKSDLLKRLEPAASEATFSVGLGHWLRRPLLAWRYASLASHEAKLIGARPSVGRLQAWWRPLHLALAALFLAALTAHVIAVTFFAGYVAAGRPITWWHITAW